MNTNKIKIELNDCLDGMKNLPDNSVDSVVTDPPYNLSFMDKEWDSHESPLAFQKWCEDWAKECIRVLKPGGHILAFGGTRTYHRLASGIEDAGFEIRDCLQWIYGAGFPKSSNIAKSMEKAGIDSKDWEGWGTGLKPANEPIILARKPLQGKAYENALEYGTGALNIDSSRVGSNPGWSYPNGPGGNTFHGVERREGALESTQGRWPANVILGHNEDCQLVGYKKGKGYAINTFDEGAKPFGDAVGEKYSTQNKNEVIEEWECTEGCPAKELESQKDGVSRFFYSAKAAPKEKNAGLTKEIENDRFQTRQCTQCKKNVPFVGHCGCKNAKIEMVAPKPTKNPHPTVKPIDLMRYLCVIITPVGGTILDPFLGSGTTGIAASLEGFSFIGFEKEKESFGIAEQRIGWWSRPGNRHKNTKDILKENDG